MTCVKSVKWRKTYFLYFCKSGDELPVVGTFWVRIEIRPLFASSLCWNLKFQETIIYVSCFKCLLETDLFWNDQLSNINVSFVWLCSYSNWNLMINLKPVFKEFFYLIEVKGNTFCPKLAGEIVQRTWSCQDSHYFASFLVFLSPFISHQHLIAKQKGPLNTYLTSHI